MSTCYNKSMTHSRHSIIRIQKTVKTMRVGKVPGRALKGGYMSSQGCHPG